MPTCSRWRSSARRRAERSGDALQASHGAHGGWAFGAYNALGRNKRSMGLNLKTKGGREVLCRLVETADVFIEDNRPSVKARLGFEYERLRAINPRLVYCSLSGYGQTGPYAEVAGHDINYIAIAGCLSLIGQKGGPPVIPLNIVADFGGGGLYATIGILAALMARTHTGAGQFVDAALLDGVLVQMTQHLSAYFQTGEPIERGNSMLDGALRSTTSTRPRTANTSP